MKPLPHQELLAVVDHDDNIVGTCARHIVHATGLMHRAVHILVFDERGRLFLQKRSMSKDLNPGLWDTSAAGHVDACPAAARGARAHTRAGAADGVGIAGFGPRA